MTAVKKEKLLECAENEQEEGETINQANDEDERGTKPCGKLSQDKSVLNAVADGDPGAYGSLAMYNPLSLVENLHLGMK